METVGHHGRTTAYTTVGSAATGTTICFVHGSGANRTVWAGQHPLGEDHRVVTVDLSGHGDSEDVDASAGYSTLESYTDDVVAVARETDADVLVGATLGGAVVLNVLLERDFDPSRAVLVATGARMGVLDDLLAWLRGDFERALEFLHEPDRLFHEPTPVLVDRSLERFRDTGRAVTSRDFETCHRLDFRDHLDRITTPTLLCNGVHDRLTPPWYNEYLADRIDDATHVEIDGAAHLPMAERPDSFTDAIRTFVSS